jgi:hypothetical protein
VPYPDPDVHQDREKPSFWSSVSELSTFSTLSRFALRQDWPLPAPRLRLPRRAGMPSPAPGYRLPAVCGREWVIRWRRDVFLSAKRAPKAREWGVFVVQTSANGVFSWSKRARMGCFRGPNEREWGVFGGRPSAQEGGSIEVHGDQERFPGVFVGRPWVRRVICGLVGLGRRVRVVRGSLMAGLLTGQRRAVRPLPRWPGGCGGCPGCSCS